MSDLIQLRGGSSALWAQRNPVLAHREPALELDTGYMKIGDGVTPWNQLGYWHGGGVDPAQFTALRAEVLAARGSRSSLDLRIEAISRYNSPCVADLPSGEVLDNGQTGVGNTTVGGLANAIRLVPYTTSRPLPIDAMGTRITTAAAGSYLRHLIYAPDSDGWPGIKLFESAENVPTVAVGPIISNIADTFTFDADRVYWIGSWHSHALTQVAVQAYGAPNLGAIGGFASTTSASLIQRVLPIANGPAPEVFGLTMSERVAGNPPRVMLRVA